MQQEIHDLRYTVEALDREIAALKMEVRALQSDPALWAFWRARALRYRARLAGVLNAVGWLGVEGRKRGRIRYRGGVWSRTVAAPSAADETTTRKGENR